MTKVFVGYREDPAVKEDLDKYCREHPEENLGTVLRKLTRIFTGREELK
jgi:hypothetical protein